MGEVQLVDYDPAWAAQFGEIRSKILRVLPDARVEHIGSTSVPGCAAKPVLDISVGLRPGSSAREAELRAAGLTFRSIRPYSAVFALARPDGSRQANVHVRYRGSDAEIGDLRFRDYLRSHPEAVRAYVAAKRNAIVASRDGTDYTAAKAPFFDQVRAAVDAWAGQSHWSPE